MKLRWIFVAFLRLLVRVSPAKTGFATSSAENPASVNEKREVDF